MFDYEKLIDEITNKSVKSALRKDSDIKAFIDAFTEELLEYYDYISKLTEASIPGRSTGLFLNEHLKMLHIPRFTENEGVLNRACLCKVYLIKYVRNPKDMKRALEIMCNAVHVEFVNDCPNGVQFFVYSKFVITDDLSYGWSRVLENVNILGYDVSVFVANYKAFYGFLERPSMPVENCLGRIGVQIK